MATLDQPIAIVFQKNADSIVLETGKQMLLELEGSQRALTQETLTTAQVINLVKEIMPEGMHPPTCDRRWTSCVWVRDW